MNLGICTYRFFIVFTLLSALLSCTEDHPPRSVLLPGSLGEHDEVLVVMNKDLWKGESGKLLRSILTHPYDVLPQDEPTFEVSHITFNHFINLHKKHRNVLFAGVVNDGSAQAKFTRDHCGKKVVSKGLEEGNKSFHVSKNDYSKPQTIIHLLAANAKDLEEVIENDMSAVMDILLNSELKKYHISAFYPGINPELTKLMSEKFDINLPIPMDWKIAREAENFVWLRKESPEVGQSIMVTVGSLNGEIETHDAEGIGFHNRGIEWRNRLGKKYIQTQIEDAYITTDSVLPVVARRISLNNNVAFENRGLWGAVGDVMGGPFVNYFIHDEKNNRVVFLEGFVYAPATTKKKAIRQLEAILAGVGI